MLRRYAPLVVVASLVAGAAALGVAVTSAPATAAGLISPSTLATGVVHVGDSYQTTLSYAANTTWTVANGQLPPGLHMSGGQISGIATQAGAFTFAVHATDGGTAALKTYTIFVDPPASTGYESRVASVLFARDALPAPNDCNQTGYLTYGIADLWTGRNVNDANNRLATVKITAIGGTPKSCDPRTDQSRNNLSLGLLIRPYELYNKNSSYFPGRLTTAAESNLVAQMWAYARPYSKLSEAHDTWSIYDSENHDAQAESFYFLAAQIFKNNPNYGTKVYYADHTTVAQQYKAWHDHWSNYFDERAKRGLFIEKGSPIYQGYTLQAILNIYNFADDPVLRKKAGMVLDLDFADYAQTSLNNIWGGPRSRSYPSDSYDGANDSMTNLGRLLFGTSTSIPGDNHALVLATSGYYPPPVVVSLAQDHAEMGSYASISRRPGVGSRSFDANHDWQVVPSRSVLDYAYCTPSYIMGTTELWPKDTHIAPSSQNRWQGIIFDTTADARVYPQAALSSVSPTNDAFLSVQSQNVMITEKRFYTNEPTLVYFPASLDGVVEQGGWVFVQEGGSYLAVRPAVGSYTWITPQKNLAANRSQRFIKLTNPTSPIIFEASTTARFPNVADFRSRIIGEPRTYTKGVLHYTGISTTKFTMFKDTSKIPLVNNAAQNYSPKNVFNSPWMQSVWGSGRITIRFGTQRATYDFSKPTAPVKIVT